MVSVRTPWHTEEGELLFPYRALESKALIFPDPPPEKMGKEDIIEIPIQYREFYQEGIGTLLSIGPGYYDGKGKWYPVDPLLKPGVKVAYDNTVPWGIILPGLDGKEYRVTMCVEVDIGGVVECHLK